jgi:hypothetical protein
MFRGCAAPQARIKLEVLGPPAARWAIREVGAVHGSGIEVRHALTTTQGAMLGRNVLAAARAHRAFAGRRPVAPSDQRTSRVLRSGGVPCVTRKALLVAASNGFGTERRGTSVDTPLRGDSMRNMRARKTRTWARVRALILSGVAASCAALSLQCGQSGSILLVDAGRDSSLLDASDTGSKLDGTSDGGSDSPNGSVTLKGAIQKGPFILGSSIQIAAIDGSGSSTGLTFGTSTADDLGDFTISFVYRGYVDMQASGFYYDEVTGGLSTAPIILHALYDVTTSGAQNAYINIVTHLAHDRAVSLMSGGMTLEAAEAEAESELVTALGIGGTGFAPGGTGVNLNELGADNDPNAYLFAVSAVMVEAVVQQYGTASLDANLQELIDTIASDLVADGTLPASVTSEISAAEEALDVDLTMDLFADRLQAIGSSATPAVLDRAVDSDGDGYRNTVDTCPLVANPDQSVIPSGVVCTVARHTTFLPPAWDTIPILADFENTGHSGAILELMSGFSLALGDGTGRFSAPVALALPSGFTPSLAYDINKDGNLDLVGWNVGATGWVAGDGAGHFGALVAFASSDVRGNDVPRRLRGHDVELFQLQRVRRRVRARSHVHGRQLRLQRDGCRVQWRLRGQAQQRRQLRNMRL